MPYKDPVKRKEYKKQYRAKNKEKIKAKRKIYYDENKEKIQKRKKISDTLYRNKNKDKIAEYNKSYRMENPHITKISEWKSRGVKLRPNEDWESVYLYWKTCERCELCDVELTDGTGELTSRNLDHDHDTGFIRDVLCWGCNIKRR